MALLELLENLKAYLEWRSRETELLESAFARLGLVLMHSDWYAEDVCGPGTTSALERPL